MIRKQEQLRGVCCRHGGRLRCMESNGPTEAEVEMEMEVEVEVEAEAEAEVRLLSGAGQAGTSASV